MDWTYCGCSLAPSRPSCPSAWHVPSAASAGDVHSNSQRVPTCFLFVPVHGVVDTCQLSSCPNCVCVHVCVSVFSFLSLTQPPDPPVSIATGPPVVIVTITPTSLLLWRAKVCSSFLHTPSFSSSSSRLTTLSILLCFLFFCLFEPFKPS